MKTSALSACPTKAATPFGMEDLLDALVVVVGAVVVVLPHPMSTTAKLHSAAEQTRRLPRPQRAGG